MDMGYGNNSGGGGASADDDEDMEFCRGMPMTMSMEGFQSSLFFNNIGGSNKANCITFLFTNWKLDSSGKFFGAMSKIK